MAKSQPKSSKKPPNLSSISSAPSKSIPSVNSSSPTSSLSSAAVHTQIPTAIVHPSFVIPPKSSIVLQHKPLVPMFSIMNQRNLVNFNNANNTAGNQVENASTATFSTQIPIYNNNNKLKTSLRIITSIVPQGAPRIQVFKIDPSLHSLFGGNLNLPVSSTERLVYLVEPPETPGGNPIARIIKMTKEEKENLAQADEEIIRQQKQAKLLMDQLAVQQSGDKPPLQTASPRKNQSLSTESDREINSSTLTTCENNRKGSALSDTSKFRGCNNVESSKRLLNEDSQNSVEEPNSSCSLFDSPVGIAYNINIQPNSKLQAKDNESHLENKEKTPSHSDFTRTNSNTKNPLLKFFTSSENSSNFVSTNVMRSSPSLSEDCGDRVHQNSSTAEISPDIFESGEIPIIKNLGNVKDIETNKTRKPLFKNISKTISSNNAKENEESNSVSLSNSIIDTKCHASNAIASATTSNIRLSASKNLEPAADGNAQSEKYEEEEDEQELSLKVRRKCGRKRRSLSTKPRDDDNKKYKSDI